MSLFTFDLKNKNKVEISKVTTINASNRTAEVSPVAYGSSFYVKQDARSDLVVFGGKDLNFGYLSNEIQVFERIKGKTTYAAQIVKSETMRQYPNIRNQLKQNGAIPSPRYAATITSTAEDPASSGRALLFGGFTQPQFANAYSYVDKEKNPYEEITEDSVVYELEYDILKKEFSWKKMEFLGPSPQPRAFHSACLKQGKLVILGGVTLKKKPSYLPLDPWILNLDTMSSVVIKKDLPPLSNFSLLQQKPNRF